MKPSQVRRLLLKRLDGDERGSSVVIALVTGLIATMLAITVITVAMSDLNLAKRDKRWTSSLAAAEAGLNGYMWKLDDDPQYWALEPRMRDPEYYPGELDWEPVPEGEGEYRLEVTPLVGSIGQPPRVLVSSSGRVGGVVRTIEMELERKTFLEWMYFTDFETYVNTSGGTSCLRYNRAPPDCGPIDFVSADVLNGPIKSNDWIRYCGTPTFQYSVESGNGGVYRASTCNVPGSPNYNSGPPNECGVAGQPCPSEMPTSNAELLRDAERGGYVYQGPIEITPLPSGKIRVYSPYGTAGVAPGPAQSRTLASAPPTSTSLEHDPPPNGVIYVREKPAPGAAQAKVYAKGTLKGQMTIGSANRIFVWGSLLYADSSPESKDVLGLIANDSIIVGDDRVGCSDPRKRPRDPEINAALLALNGDIRAWGIINPPDACTNSAGGQHVNGTLTFRGAIAQKWRGVVGTYSGANINRGYAKNYNYDPRLVYVQPPRFMEPTNTSWTRVSWREVRPRF